MTNMQALDPASDDLQMAGRHLIEASAGTGKTYNITRLYLRLLLEEQLTVQQILVVTFTKAATQELRGRIARDLRQVLRYWGKGKAAEADDFQRRLWRNVDESMARARLREALLNLDEASIFTIHGFCQRLLKQQALASGIAFDVTMEADTSALKLQAVQDWYRWLVESPDEFALASGRWPTPEQFLAAFAPLIGSQEPLQVEDPEPFERLQVAPLLEQKHEYLAALQAQLEVAQQLVAKGKTDAEQASRQQQLEALLAWLQEPSLVGIDKIAKGFLNGNRYKGKANEVARNLLAPIRTLADAIDSNPKALLKMQQMALAKRGVEAARAGLLQSKEQQRQLDFDDLIVRVYQVLTATDAGLADDASTSEPCDNAKLLAQRLAQQYPAILVDEFQDTDPQQYAIFDAIYRVGGSRALFMIGDPKQAIYSFRGGDIFAYLQAARAADQRWTLANNWRSHPGLVAGYNQLLLAGGNSDDEVSVFGFGIDYAPVTAQKSPSLPLDDGYQPLQWIHFPIHDDYGDAKGQKQSFRAVMARWCAAEITRLLQSGAFVASDIALLVRDRVEARELQQALAEAQLPTAYLSDRDNVYASDEAVNLWRALTGIVELEQDRALIAGLSSSLFGLRADDLLQLQQDEDSWEQWRGRCVRWRQLWQQGQFIGMAHDLLQRYYRPSVECRERALTNMLHLIELLQAASQQLRQPADLVNYLAEHINNPSLAAEYELRLESDAQVIRIVTHHGSKGLEYPVVFLPFFLRPKDFARRGQRTYWPYHERDTLAARIQLGDKEDVVALALEEMQAEDLRLLYVAITRPVLRCYLLTTPFKDLHLSPLGQLLQVGKVEQLLPLIEQLVGAVPEMGLACIDEVEFALGSGIEGGAEEADLPLQAAQFQHRLELNWGLSSFSALTRNLQHHAGGELAADRDEGDGPDQGDEPAPELSLRFALKKGAQAGNLLHGILEHMDFSQPDWSRSLVELGRYGALDCEPEPLQQWLQECLAAPLYDDERGDTTSLGQLKWPQTLREVEFYYPVESLHTAQLAAILQRHRQSSRTPFLTYQTLAGMMHGFIDLIFLHQGRYYVADYKSTHLGNRLSDYHPAALQANIQQNYYDLQYLLYSLALHRYLGTRLADYDPARHLGGVFYLYLRGMQPDSGAGVYFCRPELVLIEQLDQLFDQGVVEALG